MLLFAFWFSVSDSWVLGICRRPVLALRVDEHGGPMSRSFGPRSIGGDLSLGFRRGAQELWIQAWGHANMYCRGLGNYAYHGPIFQMPSNGNITVSYNPR